MSQVSGEMVSDDRGLLLWGMVVPVLLSILISWILIHGRREILGVIAGPGIIAALFLSVWLYIKLQLDEMYRTDPLYDINSQGWALLFGVVLFMALGDLVLVSLINLSVWVAYRIAR